MNYARTRAYAIGSDEVDYINYLNIALMVLSLLCAAYLPFEVFIFAYAVLGPLHYLTEISWLHDREYFSSGRYDWIILLLPIIPMLYDWVIVLLPFDAHVPSFGEFFPNAPRINLILMAVSFIAAAGMTSVRTAWAKIALIFAGVGIGLLGHYWGVISMVLMMLLPTVIHVYLFTGLFLVYGALKGRCISGFLSAVVFFIAPFVSVMLLTTPASYQASQYALNASEPFQGLCKLLVELVGVPFEQKTMVSAMRFLAFAYTYHYLNWFSKTRIINWHDISRKRLSFIILLYLLSIGAYAKSYDYGFMALFTLSFGHVVLEFPLNFRSAKGIHGELRAIVGNAGRVKGEPN